MKLMSYNIDWTTINGTATIGSSEYITSGTCVYTRWGNVVSLYMQGLKFPQLSAWGDFTIFNGVPKAAGTVVFSAFAPGSTDRLFTLAVKPYGTVTRYWGGTAASGSTDYTAYVTYIAAD